MEVSPIIRIYKEPGFRDFSLPNYATPQSAGLDLFAAVDTSVVIAPGAWRLIPTGVRIALPVNYEAQIRPRSGLALRYGITLLNSPGTIDADYRGIVGVIVINHGENDFTVHRGDRIAQMVIAPVARLKIEEVTYLRPTNRGTGGFGSTGGLRFQDDDQTDVMDNNLKPSRKNS